MPAADPVRCGRCRAAMPRHFYCHRRDGVPYCLACNPWLAGSPGVPSAESRAARDRTPRPGGVTIRGAA